MKTLAAALLLCAVTAAADPFDGNPDVTAPVVSLKPAASAIQVDTRFWVEVAAPDKA